MDLPDGNHASVSAHEQVLTVTAEEHGLETREEKAAQSQRKKKKKNGAQIRQKK